MAVDTQSIEALYDSLEGKIKATLDKQWNEGRLTGSDYAQVLSSTLTEAMQLAVKTVQNQPVVDAQIAESNAKIAEINAQISLIGSQKQLEDSKLITEQKQQNILDKQALDIVEATALKAEEISASQAKTTIAQIQSAKDALIKDAQKELISQQSLTEAYRREFVSRQTTAYDDKLRIEEAKQLANVTGMFGAGGTALPTGLDTKMFDAIAAITP